MNSGDAVLARVLEESRRRDLIGPMAISDQIGHSRGFAELVGNLAGSKGGFLLDLGSGGGLPGLVLAADLPSFEVVLLESAARRCRFLEWAVSELELDDRVEVVHGAAESAARSAGLRGRCDFVTARSFGPPAVTAECARGLLREGGWLLVSEPPSAGGGVPGRWNAEALRDMGFAAPSPESARGATFALLTAEGECPESVPRSRGIRKRPLFG